MFEPKNIKDIKKSLNIKPISVSLIILGGIASIITIFNPFINYDYKFYNILFFILIVMLIIFSIIFLKRLFEIKDEFNDDVEDYNSLLKNYYILEEKNNNSEKNYTILDGKYKFSEENRETLLMLVEDKTIENDELKVEIQRLDGFVYILLQLYSVPKKYRPDEKNMRKIIQPEKEKE